MAQEKPLIDRNISGLRWRDLAILIGCTTTVVATILGVKNDIKDLRQQKVSDERLMELRVSTMEANVKALNQQVDALRTDVIINRRNIDQK